MNIEYLKDLLYKAKSLRPDQKHLGKELKIKTQQAFNELRLYDGSSSANLIYMDFENRFLDSQNTLVSLLEAKIEILENRINQSKAKAIQSESSVVASYKQALSDRDEHISFLNNHIKEINSSFNTLKEANDLLIEQRDELQLQIEKVARIWNLRSLSFWGIIVALIVGLMWGIYQLGKDNGVKVYDTEKNHLERTNQNLSDSIIILNKYIDNFRNNVGKSIVVKEEE
ncbi:hypothetical protein GCM10011386_27100 [Parapedobacter defluvii]|uniref:Mobilization protein n=1 Tax=Parapedobacter defluvii TaxID=2045106 RepID=A0ABQ1M5L0_9SPHI|nr:hypothetical protein [Parapedobacter defluvii]GGC33556.1 hypothetical protein GCM10011386_27100 [Parapedobacter defluvii]